MTSDDRKRRFWSSVAELHDDGELDRWIVAEFPAAADILRGPARRDFLKFIGSSLLLAGLTGCNDGRSEVAMPGVVQTDATSVGIPSTYATSLIFEGFAQPVLATIHSGRPTKLDGNPEHPATRGKSDAFMQAAIMQLYDPARSKLPRHDGNVTTWDAFQRKLTDRRRDWAEHGGRGLRILSAQTTSPTAQRLLGDLLAEYPEARLHVFEPVGQAHRTAALRSALGRDAEALHRLDRCDTIVSIDDDLLAAGPYQVWNALGWATRRGEAGPRQGRARLYAAESTPGLCGAVADARLAADASRLPAIAVALAAELQAIDAAMPELSKAEARFIKSAARDLGAHRGRSLVTIGSHLPSEVQAIAPWLNQRLGNSGETIVYRDALGLRDGRSLGELAHDITSGEVSDLIVLDCNPVYTAPGELDFSALLGTVQFTVHAGLYQDETASACQWHLPLSHALESWGDARAVDGTSALLQPVLAPLYATRSTSQLLAMIGGAIEPASDEAVRETWSKTFGDTFADRWRRSLRQGFVADSAPAVLAAEATSPRLPAGDPHPSGGLLDIVFRPDPSVWDGRFANVAMLQELPKPLTKLTWENPVCISPDLARRHHLADGDLVEVLVGTRRITGAAMIAAGQAPRTVTLLLGYGRHGEGQLADAKGYSAYAVQPVEDPWHARGTIRRLDERKTLASTQLSHRIDKFDLVKEVSAAHPAVAQPANDATLYRPWPADDHAWGMVIDLDRCIGCNACVAACNVENNVLVVGPEQVAMGREMHWLRVDRYYTGDADQPTTFFQPVPCMQCEQAPCEMGCPVNASVHSPEGLNQQVYNRCIGTRTCSSYCPYKVRRFNWYDYRPRDETSAAAHNPDVTVRDRGVMEKCTYCTQRIEAAHAAADREGRAIKAGEVTTACQQACPTTAISFGNLANPDEEVSRLRQSGRHFVLLEHLGTRPRTTYLARWKDDPASDQGQP